MVFFPVGIYSLDAQTINALSNPSFFGNLLNHNPAIANHKKDNWNLDLREFENLSLFRK